MPHIRFRGTLDSTVAQISTQASELAELIKTSADNFTFENVQTKFFESGKSSNAYPFVEVMWFPRPQEAKNAMATFITEQIKKSEKHDYITVVFHEFEASSYFENGKHF